MREAEPTRFGPERGPDGLRFHLWAPSAERVDLVLEGAGEHAMDAGPDGWHRTTPTDVPAEPRYRFRIDGTLVPDPASRYQPEDVSGPSAVLDDDAFAWSDDGWTGRPWEECVLYEAHVGTATPEGTFAGLAARLDDLADLGVTALSLMPLAECAGRRNWGYDGVLPFAPESAYGTPDDLRRLVDKAHGLGIAVILDVVYNHFGPSGNYLPVYAKTFFTDRHKTPWGDGLNFDGAEGVVREFFIQNAIYWLTSFRMDGLRFDAVHAILDDSEAHFVAEVATRIRSLLPERHIHLLLENEHNDAEWLERDRDGRPLLHTAQWNDDIHHCWHVLLTGEAESYYGDFADRPVERLARCLAEGFAYQGRSLGQSWPRARPFLGAPAALGLRELRPKPRSGRQPGAGRQDRRAAREAGAGPRRAAPHAPDPDAVHGRRMGRLDALPVLRGFLPTIPISPGPCARADAANSRPSRPSREAPRTCRTRPPARPSSARSSTGPSGQPPRMRRSWPRRAA